MGEVELLRGVEGGGGEEVGELLNKERVLRIVYYFHSTT